MKYLQNFINTHHILILIICCLIAVFLHTQNATFPPFNSDEASFAYNAYSIAQTGKDEYGTVMPSRFKAFGEFKLPVTIYLITPFVKILGLTEFAARLPFILMGILSPLLFYILTKKIYNNNIVALGAAFLASVSPWIQIMSRHIHEDMIILVFTMLSMLLFARLINKFLWRDVVLLSIMSGLSLFTYHIGKLLAVYFFAALVVILIKQKQKLGIILKSILIFSIFVIFFIFTEIQNPSTRVSNLLFINNDGFKASIEELRKEYDSRIIHNKVTFSVQTLTNKYITYFSPEFLVVKGDANERFGFPGISPISPIEYVLLFVGLYFLFQKKEKYRYLILSLLLIAPLTASFSWADYSITRSFLMIIPILMLVSYGGYNLVISMRKPQYRIFISLLIFAGYGYFTFYSWNFYFNHYPKKRETVFAWQGGYKELNEYIKEKYNDYNKFYITNKLGQPYIFTLFYLQYPPEKYQKQAHLSELGEYGFGEVEQFDTFVFNFKNPTNTENAMYVGYPEDFQGTGITSSMVKKITYNGQEVFWIYEKTTQ